MPPVDVRHADQDELNALRDRVAVLEKIVDAMAGYVPGFGSSGVTRATMAAKRQFAAQASRFTDQQP